IGKTGFHFSGSCSLFQWSMIFSENRWPLFRIMLYPPCRARTISTLSPGRSGVTGHAARGTTAPLSATAMPRCAVSMAFSASSASSVAAASGSRVPLTSIRASAIGFFPRSLGRMRRQEAFEAERLYRRLDHIVENETRHGVRRHRRQQDAVAMVAGGIEQTFQRTASEDRRIVAAARPVTDAHFLDRQFLDRRHRAPGGLEQREHAAGGDRLVKALLLDGGADDQPAVAPRHHISARRPDHVGDERCRRIHAQRQHLAL